MLKLKFKLKMEIRRILIRCFVQTGQRTRPGSDHRLRKVVVVSSFESSIHSNKTLNLDLNLNLRMKKKRKAMRNPRMKPMMQKRMLSTFPSLSLCRPALCLNSL